MTIATIGMDTLSVLDNVAQIRALDPSNMYNRIFDFPEQMTDALKLAGGWKVTPGDFAGIRNIVMVGMGGSAIGADIVRSLLAAKLQIPFTICRNYVLPEFVDDETLVIASSYSGNTEETLAAVDDALGRKALMVALTTGGLLEDVAKLNDIPYIKLPGGLQPRAALGYSLVPIAVFFERIGLFPHVTAQIQASIAALKNHREQFIEDLPAGPNPAKKLAAALQGKIPVVYGGPTLTDVIAVRWKGQLCENAKVLAFANSYAEFNHNEIVGYNPLLAAHRDHLCVIQLRDVDDHPKVSRRMDIVRSIIERQGVSVHEIHSKGGTPLERMLSLIQMGDFVSYYLAILNAVDPTPVEAIETLKQELAR